MQFYWHLNDSVCEFRIQNSSALLMKMKRLYDDKWEVTCLSSATTFSCIGLEAAQKKATLWLSQVLTNVLSDLEKHNVT